MKPSQNNDSEQNVSENQSWSWSKIFAWVLGVFLFLMLLIYFLVPPIAASFVRSGIVSTVEAQYGGTCAIESLSLSWSGTVHVRNMTVKDRMDQTMISIDEIEGHVDPIAAIGGAYRVQASIRRPTVSVRRLENGRLNLVSQQKSGTNSSPSANGSGPSTASNDELLSSITGSIELTGGTVRILGPEGDQTELRDLEVRSTLQGADKPIDLSLSLRTPGDEGGQFIANGTLQPDTFRNGSLDARIEQFPLSELSAAAALFSQARNLKGRVDGTLTLTRTEQLTSTTDLTVRDLHLDGFGEPIDLREATLSQESSLDPEGTGSVSARLKSGQMLTASLDGTMKQLLNPNRSLNATWNVDSNLKEASDRIPALLNLNTGWRLEGTLTSEGKLDVQSTTASDGAVSYNAQFDMQANGSSVRATDPEGQTVSLGDPSFNADLSTGVRATDVSGSVGSMRFDSGQIHTLSMDLPGLKGSFSGGWQYRSSAPEFDDLSGSLTADLSQLRSKLAPFTDFRGYEVDGMIDLTLNGSGSEPFQTTGRMTTSNLTVSGPDMPDTGPFNLTVKQSSTVGAKNGTVQLDNLELSGEGLAIRIYDGRLERVLQTDAHAEASWNATADLGVLTEKFSSVLQPRYEALLNRPNVRTVHGTVEAGGTPATVELQRSRDGWGIKGAGNMEVLELACMLENGEKISLREQLVTRVRGGSYRTGTGTARLDKMELQTAGLTLDLNNTAFHPMDRPPHITSLSAEFQTDLSELQNLTRIYGSDRSAGMDGKMEGTVEVSGEPAAPGRMKMTTNLQFNGVKMTGFEQGTAGPFTGRLTSSEDLIDLREQKTSQFHDVMLDTEGMTVRAAGTATGLGGGVPESTSLDLSGTVESPETVSARLRPFLAGYRLSGEPIQVQLRASRSSQELNVQGHKISSSALELAGGWFGEEAWSVNNLRSTGALTLTGDRVSADQLKVSMDAGRLSVNGAVPFGSSSEGNVDLESQLDVSLADIKPLLPGAYREGTLSGALSGHLKFGGRPERMTVTGKLSSGNLSYAPPRPDSVRIDQEEVELTSNLTVELLDDVSKLDLESLALDSSFLRFQGNQAALKVSNGRMSWSSWETSLDYHPDRLGAIAGPMLPQDVKLSGTDWQSARFTLHSGEAPMDAVPYALQGEGTYQVNRIEWKGTELKGDGNVKLNADLGTVTWDLTSGEGAIKGSAEFDLRAPDQLRSPEERNHRFKLNAQNVKTRQQMGPYLQMLHPLFASVGGETEGTVDLSFDLNMTGPLMGEEPMKRLAGPGSLRASNVQIRSGSFAGQVLRLIDEKSSWNVSIPKVDIRIDGRRIHHSNFPIQLSDHRVTTSGWISTDGNYQLDVTLPVTQQLIERYPQLKSLKGEYLTLPVKQTDGSPSIDMQSVIQKALQRAIEKQLQDRLRGLFR